MNKELYKVVAIVLIAISIMLLINIALLTDIALNLKSMEEQNAEVLHTLKLLYNDYEEYD